LPPSPEAAAQLLEAALDTRTCRILEAVDSFKTASREQQQQLLDSWDKAKIPENLEKLGKNITVLGVKLDMGGTASAARGGGAAARGTETASSSSEATAEQAQQQLTAALADLGKNLSSQLDDVHDMVFNAEESTARVLAEIKAEVKVG
jgi:arginase family enzyme